MAANENSGNQSSTKIPAGHQGYDTVCWSPWPCDECCKRTTAVDYLVRSYEANATALPREIEAYIDAVIPLENQWLKEWCRLCPHSGPRICRSLPKLGEGSEHLVYYDPLTSTEFRDLIKLTKKGIFGQYYEYENGRIYEYRNIPGEYLCRLRLIEDAFGFSATPIGLTDCGQIVTRQQFIDGDDPSQKDVDDFLSASGAIPVNQRCFLWKMIEEDIEVWIGDARDENFVKTPTGIVPIDLRMWMI